MTTLAGTFKFLRTCVALPLLGVWVGASGAEAGPALSAQQLRASHTALQGQLRDNPFRRPLLLDSQEAQERLTGEIHAVLAYPFSSVRSALNDPARWCEVLSLHSNTKYCRASAPAPDRALLIYVGSKTPQALSIATRVDMAYTLQSDTPEYLAVTLRAPSGPLGTSDYRVMLESIPLADGTTYIHLTYSTATNLLARMAMQAYLATAGSGKVGFTPAATPPGGPPEFIAGARGAVERNTMRYYLAIDAYLASLQAAPTLQLETRLQDWFSAVERYPRQLHEMERQDYLDMKRAEHLRQQAPP